MKRVLLVSSSTGRLALSKGLEQAGFVASLAPTCEAARPQLLPGAFDAVVVQRVLPDGGWCNILHELISGHMNPAFVVITQKRSGWRPSVPFQRGGEYVLSKPSGTLTDVIDTEIAARHEVHVAQKGAAA